MPIQHPGKSTMKRTLLLLAAFLIPAAAPAQNRPTPPPSPGTKATVPSQKTTYNVPQRKTSTRSTANPRVEITENIVLQLKGDFQTIAALDLELTGVGPRFNTNLVLPSTEEKTPPVIISFDSIVTLAESGSYQVDYTLSARIAITTAHSSAPHPGAPTTRNVEYRDVSLSGSVKLVQGKPVTLSKVDGKALTLGISKPTK